MDDLAKSRSKEYPWSFDAEKANRVCRFIEMLPHTKGEWAARGETIRLEAWQKFIVCAIFGWVSKQTGMRRFREAYVCVPRKNGKSAFASGVGLDMFVLDGEFGAEVYSGATTERQAWEVFRPARFMVARTPQLQKLFGIQVNAKNLYRPEDGSRFEPVIGKPGDGASPSCAIIDEYHEHETDALYDTMKTGHGARRQPLDLIITTAGSNTAGPCHLLQQEVEKELDGTLENERRFGIIYTIDEGDDWTSDEALRKANPNYDVSVFGEFLRDEQQQAIRSPQKQNIFKTKHLNIWVNAMTAWMNMERWRHLADSSLSPEEFKDCPCWVGNDLSSAIDITSSVKVFRRVQGGKNHCYVFCRHYLPKETAMDPTKQHYQRWVQKKALTVIDGPTVDYSLIRKDIVADVARYNVRTVAFDPWSAIETQQELMREIGEERVITIPQKTEYLSHPMKQLEVLTLNEQIHFDGDEVLTWMMSNVVAKVDANGNIFPRKERNQNKIDGVVALILALKGAIADVQTTFRYNGF